ncbi:MAG: hypothetical protein QJR01_00530 [Kyrpidia sp.]|nr:hypothetical protein [Kyrpidia sp.]
MSDTAARSYQYSIEGSVKRVLFLAGRPMTVGELSEAVKALGRNDLSEEDLRGRLEAALTTGTGAFECVEGAWRLRRGTQSELNDLAHDYLQQAGRPMKFGDILRHLQTMTHRSRGELMSRVDLDGDWRFARLASGEWVLTGWPETLAVVPEAAATAAQTEEEGWTMTGVATEELVLQTVRMIHEQLRRLRGREEAISREALECFYREDLSGIERLMRERRSVVNLIAKLDEVAADLPDPDEAAVSSTP